MSDSMTEVAVENYGWHSSHNTYSCGYVAPAILSVLERLKLRRVLDLGAGNGVLCSMMESAGIETVGVEYDQRGVDIARASFPRIRFYNLGVQHNPAALMSTESPFDAVVSTEVIEHLFAPHMLPKFAAATLVAGGYLIISTPYHGYLKNLALSILNKWDFHHTPLWHGGHIKFWSRTTLTRLLNEYGFKVLEFHGVGRLPLLWKSMILVAQKGEAHA